MRGKSAGTAGMRLGKWLTPEKRRLLLTGRAKCCMIKNTVSYRDAIKSDGKTGADTDKIAAMVE